MTEEKMHTITTLPNQTGPRNVQNPVLSSFDKRCRHPGLGSSKTPANRDRNNCVENERDEQIN